MAAAHHINSPRGAVQALNYVWDIPTLEFVEMLQPTGGGGGIADTVTVSGVVHVDDNAGSLTVDNPNLDVALSTRLKPADTLAAVSTVGTITNVVHVDDNLGSLTVDNPNLDVALSTRLKPADTLAAVTTVGSIGSVVHIDDNAGSLTVDGSVSVSNFPATQAVSIGAVVHVDDNATTLSVDDGAGSLTIDSPNLDVALSTRLKPADTLTKVATVDTITNVVHIDDNAGSLTVDGSVGVTGNVTVVQPTGSNLHVVVDTAPTTAVTVASLPLPSNAAIETGGNLATLAAKDFATSAKQDTGNTSLSTIATNMATAANQTTGNTSLAALVTALAANGALNQLTFNEISTAQNELLKEIVTELRVMNWLIREGLSVRDEVDNLRSDPSFYPQSQINLN